MVKTIITAVISGIVAGVIITVAVFSVVPSSGNLQGTTNLDSLSLSGDLTVAGLATFGTSTSATSTEAITTGTAAVLSTTTIGNLTLAAADINNYGTILSTSTYLNAAFTMTLPASSTLSALVPNAGNRRRLWIINGTTTAGVNITLAGNTGVILNSATSTKTLRSGANALIEFFRSPTSTDIYATIIGIGN